MNDVTLGVPQGYLPGCWWGPFLDDDIYKEDAAHLVSIGVLRKGIP